jgi:L-seryl-tRNA(Ser) seleniumtransferase
MGNGADTASKRVARSEGAHRCARLGALTPELSALPSVDRLLGTAVLVQAAAAHGRDAVVAATRAALGQLRAGMRETGVPPPPLEAIAAGIDAALRAQARPSLRSVVNLTGTVLHTNLGRALLPDAAVGALAQAAAAPCNLEFDLASGARGERDAHVESLLCELTGAEAALLVNNNAAAVFLVLNTLAGRREVIVSRGELVEIGGQFRIPDIMARSGAILREVGATNRTHSHDYAGALGPRTALLLKVHTSNYEVRGFTSSVDVAALAPLARDAGVPLVEDLGSGTLVDLRRYGLPHEPTVREALAAGADLVTFSGDKLLGGPQCGIVAGRRDLVARLRRNPLKRALRVDKLVLAALEPTLRLYLDPDGLARSLPTLRLLTRPLDEIEAAAARLAAALTAVLPPPYEAATIACRSQIGSGALPVDLLPSAGVQVRSTAARRQRDRDVQQLAAALRALPRPVVGRIEDHALVLDCRCLLDADAVGQVLVASRADLAHALRPAAPAPSPSTSRTAPPASPNAAAPPGSPRRPR